jgi:hypothetical protein
LVGEDRSEISLNQEGFQILPINAGSADKEGFKFGKKSHRVEA